MMMTLRRMRMLTMKTLVCFPEQMITMAKMDVRRLMLYMLDLMRLRLSDTDENEVIYY